MLGEGTTEGGYMRNNVESNFSMFVVGLGIGAAVGLFLAPKSGDETRQYLKQKAEEGKEFAERKARELQTRASDVVDHGKQIVERELDSISRAIDAGRQAYEHNKPNGSV
jgi:gas vesicle protein